MTAVRFGKKNRNSLAMGWRAKSQPAAELGIVASEERDALLYSPSLPDDDYESPPETAISPATRRLATALGRFERQIAKAREGAPQEAWSDDCMDQLINAVEIAVSEGWDEVVEALTETGRILQSYENEGQAHLCVPFLSESFEIFSQMVSDLILGKIRSGLMQKWRNRYRMALEDLKDAGIPLVRDDEESHAARRGAQLAREARIEPARPLPFIMPSESAAPSGGFGAPRLEDYLAEDAADVTDEASRDAEDREFTWPSRPAVEWVASEAPVGMSRDFDEVASVPSELPRLAPLGGDLLSLGAHEDPPAHEAPQPDDGFGGTSPEVIEHLDVLCERLSHMERESDADLDGGFQTIGATVAFLEEQAQLCGRDGCVDLCHAMAILCAYAAERGRLPEDKFFELAYAFCGVYVEADDTVENPMIRSWITESESLLAGWDTPIQEQPEELEEPLQDIQEEEAEFVVEEPLVDEVVPESVEDFDDEVNAFPPDELPEEVGQGPEFLLDRPEPELEAPIVEEAVAPDEEAAAAPIAEEAVVPVDDDPVTYAATDSPEMLLQTAQRAMFEGNAAEAKRLALHAAAMLARIEVEEAAQRVTESERRLSEGANLIDDARAEVQRAEQTVADTARSVAEGRKALEDQRARISGIEQNVSDIEARVTDLDEQIRLLQARRDEEARSLADTRTSLDDARANEALAESEAGALAEAEEEARVKLEDARQRVKSLQRKRTEVEAAMERAREALTQRRLSLADMEQMLAQVHGKTQTQEEADPGEFLF